MSTPGTFEAATQEIDSFHAALEWHCHSQEADPSTLSALRQRMEYAQNACNDAIDEADDVHAKELMRLAAGLIPYMGCEAALAAVDFAAFHERAVQERPRWNPICLGAAHQTLTLLETSRAAFKTVVANQTFMPAIQGHYMKDALSETAMCANLARMRCDAAWVSAAGDTAPARLKATKVHMHRELLPALRVFYHHVKRHGAPPQDIKNAELIDQHFFAALTHLRTACEEMRNELGLDATAEPSSEPSP